MANPNATLNDNILCTGRIPFSSAVLLIDKENPSSPKPKSSLNRLHLFGPSQYDNGQMKPGCAFL